MYVSRIELIVIFPHMTQRIPSFLRGLFLNLEIFTYGLPWWPLRLMWAIPYLGNILQHNHNLWVILEIHFHNRGAFLVLVWNPSEGTSRAFALRIPHDTEDIFSRHMETDETLLHNFEMHWSQWGVSHLGQAKLVNSNQILSQVADQNCEAKFHMWWEYSPCATNSSELAFMKTRSYH